jgi:hypothetical protein
MTNYQKKNLKEYPNKKRLKQLDKSAWARQRLTEELAKNNPSWQAILITEMMQRLGMV